MPSLNFLVIRPFVAALLLASSALAHQEIDAALERLNAELATTPLKAELYLERGELYAKHEDWVSAEANYLRAAELAPRLARLDCARGALALAQKQPAEAREHLERALALTPRDGEALILRSRSRAALNDRTGAVEDLEAAIAVLRNPRPEVFLELASLLPTAADAIRSLDAAMARIGPIHTLQMRAFELEETSGRIDAALRRLDTMAARSERREIVLKRRGDLLLRAGRTTEARAAYRDALAAIATLPEWLRQSADTRQLALELNSSS